MTNEEKTKFWATVGMIVTGFAIVGVIGFLNAAIIRMAWRRVATELYGAPLLSYWDCYWVHWAVASMFKATLREAKK